MTRKLAMALRTVVLVAAPCTLFPLLLAAPSEAAIEEIEATGEFHLGDQDSKLEGHDQAMLVAKRNALEKAGTYVESLTEVKDAQVTRDEIRTYAAAVIEVTETREPKWEMQGQNLKVTVWVKALVDSNAVARQVAALRKDAQTTRELEALRAKVQQLEGQVAAANRQLPTAKGAEVQRVKESRSAAIKAIEANELVMKATAALTGSEALDSAYATGTLRKESLVRARQYTEQALKHDQDNVDALTLMASILYEEGQTAEAERVARKAVRLQPKHAMALGTLGFIVHQQGKNDEAIDVTRRAIALQPDSVPLHINLGGILYALGDKTGAVAEYREAVRLDPKSGMARLALGAALGGEGDRVGARREYDMACQLGDATGCNRLNARLGGCLPAARAADGLEVGAEGTVGVSVFPLLAVAFGWGLLRWWRRPRVTGGRSCNSLPSGQTGPSAGG